MKGQRIAVDVFAGSGGLSSGLQRAGFDVCAAVEIDATAAATYRLNHRATKVFEKNVVEISGAELRTAARSRQISLLAGCAPCQGFCSLTRKFEREDPRNLLILEMGRLIEELLPTAIFMENVPGLATWGRPIFERFLGTLTRLGYLFSWQVVQMADYGIPQSRKRLVLLAGRGFGIPFPKPTHARAPGADSRLKPWVSVRSVLKGRPPAVSTKHAAENGGARNHDWHVVRVLQPQTRERLRAAIPGGSWLDVEESVRPKCHRTGYVGFTNVYGRMAWDQPSPTITAGCTTPAKGRFGHPDRRRTTISVREAALLQTFPPRYKFATDEIESACGMIGNAVPPKFAAVVAKEISAALDDHEAVTRGKRRT